MGLFNRNKKKPEIREDTTLDESVVSDPLIKALFGEEGVDRDTVMNIPAISACVNMIADTVSTLKIKLYRRDKDRDFRFSLYSPHTLSMVRMQVSQKHGSQRR